jgi:hypothetical protein
MSQRQTRIRYLGIGWKADTLLLRGPNDLGYKGLATPVLVGETLFQ